MTRLEILKLLLLAVIVGGGVLGIRKVVSMYNASKVVKTQERITAGTGDILKDGVAADDKRDTRDTSLAQAREDFRKQYEKDEGRDPTVASRSNTIVPQRVRDNFRARRLARERAGCVGKQCEARPEEDTSSER